MFEIEEITHLKDLWDPARADAMGGDQLKLLRYRSNLLGSDLRITNFGGGNTSSGYSERLILANPLTGATTAQIRYLTTSGQVISQNVSVPALGRTIVNVNSAIQSGLHSTVVAASSPIVAERQDFFITNFNGSVLGSSTLIGSNSVHSSWYLAQGDTSSGHAESLAIANPNNATAQVQVVYYLASGAPIIKTYTLAANARLTVSLTNDVGANQNVGVAVYASTPIVTEEVMLFNVNGATGGYTCMALGA